MVRVETWAYLVCYMKGEHFPAKTPWTIAVNEAIRNKQEHVHVFVDCCISEHCRCIQLLRAVVTYKCTSFVNGMNGFRNNFGTL